EQPPSAPAGQPRIAAMPRRPGRLPGAAARDGLAAPACPSPSTSGHGRNSARVRDRRDASTPSPLRLSSRRMGTPEDTRLGGSEVEYFICKIYVIYAYGRDVHVRE